jgi:group I intron endonuclease
MSTETYTGHIMKAAVIYKIINTLNNKFYVGSTNNQAERFRTHRKKLRSHKHHCAHLQAAWDKYGEDVFVFHVVETLPDASFLQQAEDKWLSAWVGKDECYNHGMRSGAPWRGVPKKLHPMYGKPRTEETKQLLREARLNQPDPRIGTKHSFESIQKMVETRKANGKASGANHYRYGKKLSEETRKKIGDTQRGAKKKPRVYTPEGLEKARANMLKNAVKMEIQSFDAVYDKFSQGVKDKYDFSNASYTGALVRIEGVKCPEHGVFSQYAAQFRKGRGCPSCGADERAESKRKQMKEAWATEKGRKTFLENRPNKLLAPHS